MSATISRYRTPVADDEQSARDRLKKLLSGRGYCEMVKVLKEI